MDFYDDIDIDFGDKNELGVGDVISLLDKSPKDDKRKNGKKQEIVFDNEIDEGEYEHHPAINYFSDAASPDVADDIAREVVEVTGNGLLNEQLEHKYKVCNNIPAPKKSKSKSSKEKKPPSVKPNPNITKKSELVKEMGTNHIGEQESDSKVTFCKRKKNALINGLNLTEIGKQIDRPASPEKTIEAEETEVQTEIDPPVPNSYVMDKVRHWLDNLHDSYSEGSFYSINNTSNTTDESSLSYFTAKDSEDAPKKSYRATSKRSSASKITPAITDANVSFKTSPKTTPPPAIPKHLKTITKKTPEIYIPGSYNREFNYKATDFPAIR